MIKFGVAGNSNSFYNDGYKHTFEAGRWCNAKGIDAFEYSFGKGVKMTKETAEKIGTEFLNNNVELSVHAPYFINFANPDPLKIENSVNYVIQSIKKLKEFSNGKRIVVHPAAQGKATRDEAVNETVKNLNLLSQIISDNELQDFIICLETMGKLSQIGNVEEIVDFCKIANNYYPCIDFGHVNARTRGSLKTEDDFARIIDYMLENLPFEKVDNMHIHFSKIMYGESGEIKHLTFEDEIYGPKFDFLAKILKERNLSPTIICESDGTQAEDCITMKNIYLNI